MSFSRLPAPFTTDASAGPGQPPSWARGWAPLVARAAALAVVIGSAIALTPGAAMAAPEEEPIADQPEEARVAVTAAVSLRVKDPDLGKPLAGVRIMTVVEELLATTDEDGTAVIPAHKLTDPVLLLEREGYQLLVVEVEELAARNLVSMVAEHAPAAPRLARPALAPPPVAMAPTTVAKAAAVRHAASTFAAPRPHTFRAPAPPSRVAFAPLPPDLEAMLPSRPAFRFAAPLQAAAPPPAQPAHAAPAAAAPVPPKAARPPAAVAKAPPRPHAVARALAATKAPPPLAVAKAPPPLPALAHGPAPAARPATKPIPKLTANPLPLTKPHLQLVQRPAPMPVAKPATKSKSFAARTAPAPVRLASIELPPAPRFAVVMPKLAPAPTEDGIYVVRKGDSLAAIAKAHLGGERAWRSLHDANRATVSNPRLIFPGQRLVLPGRVAASGQG